MPRKKLSANQLQARGSWRASGRLRQEQSSQGVSKGSLEPGTPLPADAREYLPSGQLRLMLLQLTEIDCTETIASLARKSGVPDHRLRLFTESQTELKTDEFDRVCLVLGLQLDLDYKSLELSYAWRAIAEETAESQPCPTRKEK